LQTAGREAEGRQDFERNRQSDKIFAYQTGRNVTPESSDAVGAFPMSALSKAVEDRWIHQGCGVTELVEGRFRWVLVSWDLLVRSDKVVA
jgi:hypothetical protein